MNTKTLDWNDYIQTARRISAEGCVVLENNNNVLPYQEGTKLAIFGRIQNHYYKSGTGSGGMVAVDRVVSIPDALAESGKVELNKELIQVYTEWEKANPVIEGLGWGKDLWCQQEMPVSEELARTIAAESDAALVIIGRTAGEDKDNQNAEGSWLLTETEKNMLRTVRSTFTNMCVLLNVGNIIDMSFIDTIAPDAVLYAWQGGMVGGYGAADILTGAVCPSGRLTDTIAYKLEDYPAHPNFGNADADIYAEDVYVGYRYFETAAQNKVRYPFGYGLSYTTFTHTVSGFAVGSAPVSAVNQSAQAVLAAPEVSFDVTVTNTGTCSGKQVIQIYAEQPQGLLGKPARVLAAFAKTKELPTGETETLHFSVELASLASFDDTGKTGHKSCSVLEAGTYTFYAGADVRTAEKVGSLTIDELTVIEELHQAMPPVVSFDRLKPMLKNGETIMASETVPASAHTQMKHRNEALETNKVFFPQTAPANNEAQNKNIQLAAVLNGDAAMPDFLAQLTDEDLAAIIRGEGMGSPKVTPGTAAAFGGISPHLISLGIPCACCTDGPSGLRLDSGCKAFSMPIGTMLACTFNTSLVTELYAHTGLEMAANHIEVLLGPGINIHRYPLNGRNFEYFSEDPLVTGQFAVAVIRGLHLSGVSGSLKHFCGNNQEYSRSKINSVISERALREIYLKGFEIAVKQADADVIMTTYGAVNGIWTAGNYDLNTLILRHEWGFTGICMTDWWAQINDEGKKSSHKNFAAMARAQNDLYMVCPDSAQNLHGDNTLVSLKSGTLDRSELLRNAENILIFLMHSRAMKRLCGTEVCTKIENRPVSPSDIDSSSIVYYPIERDAVIPLEHVAVKQGHSFSFGVDLQNHGDYSLALTAKTQQGNLAQIPVSISANGSVIASFTWNNTEGAWETKQQNVFFLSKYSIVKFYFAQSGLELKDIVLKKL